MKTALLVGRGACVSSALCDLITPGGVRIVCAPDCATALRGLQEEGLRPRVVVLEAASAGADAPSFLEQLRRSPRLRRAQVIVLAEHPTAAQALVVRHGALGSLPRDVEDWRLLQVIDRLSGRRAPEAASRS